MHTTLDIDDDVLAVAKDACQTAAEGGHNGIRNDKAVKFRTHGTTVSRLAFAAIQVRRVISTNDS